MKRGNKMKKTIALLITLIMVFTLVACNSNTPAAPPAANAPAANAPAAPSTAPSAPAASSNAPAAPSAAPSAGSSAPAASAQPSEPAKNDFSVISNSVGFFNSGVDPFSRDTYDIAFVYIRAQTLMQVMIDAYVSLEPVLNFKLTEYCANGDVDAQLQNIEVFAGQGVDGFLVVIDAGTAERTREVLESTGVPYVALLNSVQDDKGNQIVTCVGLDNYWAGATITQWLYDNYKTYWGEIDESKITLLALTFSPSVDFQNRIAGIKDKFMEVLPNNRIIDADAVTGGINEQTGFEIASGVLAAHPEVEYWFIPPCVDIYGQGVMSVAESLGIEDRVLMVTTDTSVITAKWDSGYDGNWVACLSTYGYQYGVPAICGLVAILDGATTMDDIWSSLRAPNDLRTFYKISGEMVTRDTYQSYLARLMADSGVQ